MDRRTFLGTVALGTAGALAPRRVRAEAIQKIGVQLYTVRTEMEKDFDGTIARVAAVGYKEVEFAGYFNRTPQQVRAVLDRNGLVAPSVHVDYATLSGEKLPGVLDACHTIGHGFLVCPYLDDATRAQPDIYKRLAEAFNRIGEASRKANIQFAYHNHNFEFAPVDGKLPYDFLLEQTDPSLVKMEMDLCWITVAGLDPLDYFRKYPGRFPMVHVKGLAKKPANGATVTTGSVLPDIRDVGTDDIIDWKRIFAQSKQAGIVHYFVEHDTPKVPFDSLKASYEYLRQLQF